MPDLEKIFNQASKPPVFEPGDACFWTEEYVAQQLLAIHLNADTDAASRRFETIKRTVSFWLDHALIKAEDQVIDLGCGPGLYCERLAAAGVRVTGIDQSEGSIAYAMQQAEKLSLPIEYNCMNFLELQVEGKYSAAIQVFGEFCTLSDEERDLFLMNVFRALKPGGIFIMDVSTRKLRLQEGLKNNWYVSAGGFWRPMQHIVLETGFDYPEQDIWLDQYIVLDDISTTSYRCWFHDYSLSTLIPVVEKAGFHVHDVWGDLSGAPYSQDTDWIAIALKKA